MKKIFILLFFLVYSLIKAQINLDSNLVACYSLNGNGYDPIHGLHANFIGNVIACPDNYNNNFSAVSFSGLNGNMIEIPAHHLLKPNALSFSAWIKPLQGFTSTGYLVFTKNTSGASLNTEAYALSIENSSLGKKFRLKKSDGTNSTQLDNTTPISANIWYHVCFTIDNNFMNLYVNGVLESSSPTTVNFNYASDKNIYLAASNEIGNMGYFTGVIDNVRFYNRILSAAEINQLYQTDPNCVLTTQAPVASFSVSGPCINQEVTFVDLSTNHPDTWKWQIPGGTTNSLNQYNPIYTFSASGNYTATLISSNNMGSDTAQLTFYINPLPNITTVSTRTVICKWETMDIRAYGGLTYVWNTAQTGSIINVMINKTTSYTVTGTDSIGCTSQGIHLLKVVSDCWNSIPSINFENASIVIAPNPSSGRFSISTSIELLDEYFVYNLNGAQVLNGKIEKQSEFNIDLSSQPKGLYFITLKSGIQTKTLKLIKE
jgi:PKD repeat protein